MLPVPEVVTSPNSALNQQNSPSFNLVFTVFSELITLTNETVYSYLRQHFPQLDDREYLAWLTPLQVNLNQCESSGQSPVKPGDIICITLLQHFEQNVDCQWFTLWQNDEIMAVYKPAPLAVSRTTRNLYNTLISLIRRQSPYPEAQLLHRLDIETSGVILIAKNKAADQKWKKQLSQLIVKKTYLAIVNGIPDWQSTYCENELAEKQDQQIRCQMFVVDSEQPREQYKKPKLCKTGFKLIDSTDQQSLIECQLFTGRKHQIRAHLAALGHPIVGDKIYSHQGHFFLKRLASEQGLNADDYRILGAINHQLCAVELQLQISDTMPIVTIDCRHYAPTLSPSQ